MNSRERFLNACNRLPVDRPPVWLMRQAGRYLPEYKELREKYDFMTMCKRSDLIFDVSMQPWHRFKMDAVIVFSDILLPLEAMGPKLRFEESAGPRFEYSVKTTEDVLRLEIPHVRLSFGYLYDALENLRHELQDDAALLGFIGAPWTLAVYLIEGGSGDFQSAVRLLKEDSKTIHLLMEKIATTVTSHALEQIRTGVDVIQIFDTWAGLLSPEEYQKLALPHLAKVIAELKKNRVPVTLFIKKTSPLLKIMLSSGANVISIGPDISLSAVFKEAGGQVAIQGNLDPEILLRSPSTVERETYKMLESIANCTGYIANLGHGVLPKTPVESVKTFVETVRNYKR